ncbi:hypothetical protein, partial [Clostridium estertheticum]|uniref:hypothetical protein n=1 Tax=Clostridium estertheticum TaxID=238834 RepID=UPI001C0E63FE
LIFYSLICFDIVLTMNRIAIGSPNSSNIIIIMLLLFAILLALITTIAPIIPTIVLAIPSNLAVPENF